MTERYGLGDDAIPGWEAPSGPPAASDPQYSPPTPSYPPPPGGTPTAGSPPTPAYPPPSGGVPTAGPPPIPQGVPTYRSWQPGFMPLRPLSLGDFLSLPMKAISANRQVILGGPLLCMIVSLLISILPIILFSQNSEDYVFSSNTSWGSLSGATIVLFVITTLVSIGVDAAARALVIPGVSRAILGERLTLGQAWSTARTRIPQLLLFYLLMVVAYFGLVLAVAILGVISAGILLIPIVIAAIPAVFLVVPLLGIAISALVLERLSAMDALKRAFSLVKGSAWRLIGNFFVICIVLYFLMVAIFAALNVGAFGLATTSPSFTTAAIVSIVIFAVFQIFASVIQYSFLGSLFTLMYVDLRIRTEGFDVDLARAAENVAGR